MPGSVDEPLVVKLGGTTLAEQRGVLDDVARLARERRLVVVHGGGRRLTDWLERLEIETRFEAGLRVTDDRAIEVATAVLGGLVNAELVAALHGRGSDAVGLTGIDGGLLVAERQPSLGRVATVRGARTRVLDALLRTGLLPVVAPLALDRDGIICNVNADEVASGLSGALRGRLVLLTDSDGVRDSSGALLRDLDAATAEELISAGVISAGMVPKVRAALAALANGASGAVIAAGSAESALARALDDSGFGTRLRGAT